MSPDPITAQRPGWPLNFFAEGGKDVAIRITPGTGGILQVFADGDKIYDRAEENGQYPSLPRVKEMRAAIREKLSAYE